MNEVAGCGKWPVVGCLALKFTFVKDFATNPEGRGLTGRSGTLSLSTKQRRSYPHSRSKRCSYM